MVVVCVCVCVRGARAGGVTKDDVRRNEGGKVSPTLPRESVERAPCTWSPMGASGHPLGGL